MSNKKVSNDDLEYIEAHMSVTSEAIANRLTQYLAFAGSSRLVRYLSTPPSMMDSSSE